MHFLFIGYQLVALFSVLPLLIGAKPTVAWSNSAAWPNGEGCIYMKSMFPHQCA
ncbi:hypothetical protein FIBSPDRAFT_877018 [Athelia psychrophila]|uniref:Uncharacterized protein n=1 Tax=Athelia psychrophila TaxID=1759441 RepID=A0A167WB22_9AGAM|nr:hypothetical protein FIBSPDRAFT_877018 [Fibularhizoctonia sp. CBS 109695]